MSIARGLCLAAILAGASMASAALTPDELIFDNYNGAEVNGFIEPFFQPSFTLAQTMTISHISTFHYYYLPNVRPTIGLERADGTTIGEWQSQILLFDFNQGPEGVPVDWIAYANVTLDPGTYFITDSQPVNWSHNLESGNTGFARVYASVPEPTSLLLLGCIAGGLMIRRRSPESTALAGQYAPQAEGSPRQLVDRLCSEPLCSTIQQTPYCA